LFGNKIPISLPGWADTAVEWLIAAKSDVNKRNTAGFAPVPEGPGSRAKGYS